MTFLLAVAVGCLTVDGDTIRAGDVARVVPEFASVPADTALVFAPSFGVRRQMAPSDLNRIAVRHGLHVVQAPALCFERPTGFLDAQGVTEAIRSALAETNNFRLEILDFSRYPVPRGKLEFQKAGLTKTPSGKDRGLVWRGKVLYGNHRSHPIWARIRIAMERHGVRAVTDLIAGKPIEASQVKVETWEGNPFDPEPAQNPGDVVDLVPRSRISAGSPVMPGQLVAPPLVTRGEQVAVEVRSGAAQLRLEGKAQKAGKQGEMITIRNPTSGKTFSGRVDGKGRVVVTAGGASAKDR